MRIFISYSNPNLSIVRSFANKIETWGDVFYWNQSYIPGDVAWEQLYNWIDYSDIVLLLITGNTVVRAKAVLQEIDRAKSMGRTIIPIVSNNVPKSELGFLSGINYQPIDVSNPGLSLNGIDKIVAPNDRLENNKQLGLLLLGISFILLLSDKV